MPEQSVKQFRPGWMQREEWDRLRGDIHDETIDYIERLENALDAIAAAVIFPGAYELGGVEVEYEDDGNTLKSITPPWRFFDGTGGTFLEAVENHIKGEQDA